MAEAPRSDRIGGMALANGLLVHGPRHWAAAVEGPDGNIIVASGRKWVVRMGPLDRVPVVRGLARLVESFVVLPAVRRGLPQARFAMEDRRAAVVAGAATLAASVLRRRTRSVFAQEVVGATLGLVPALVALRGSRAAVWHAVEHMSIAAYESGGTEAVADASGQAKEHRRCGSNLVLPLMVSTVVGNTLARRLPLGRVPGARTVISAVGIGVAVEVFAFSTRRPEHIVSRVVHTTGHAMQVGFVTRDPTREELKVGRAAMEALIDAETGRRA